MTSFFGKITHIPNTTDVLIERIADKYLTNFDLLLDSNYLYFRQ